MQVDPGHEFIDVLMQLCGPGVVYAPGAAYPPINNSGFVADYVVSPSSDEGKLPPTMATSCPVCRRSSFQS